MYTRTSWIHRFFVRWPKLLKIFNISLTFRFDKLWHLSKSVHTGEYSQILTSDKCQVSNKKYILFLLLIQNKIQTSKRICSCLNQENISSTLRTTHQQRSSFPLIRLASKKKKNGNCQKKFCQILLNLYSLKRPFRI
jgi:hypothetical protein